MTRPCCSSVAGAGEADRARGVDMLQHLVDPLADCHQPVPGAREVQAWALEVRNGPLEGGQADKRDDRPMTVFLTGDRRVTRTHGQRSIPWSMPDVGRSPEGRRRNT